MYLLLDIFLISPPVCVNLTVNNHVPQYGGRRVVVANGIPDHEAEHDQYFVNPNTRCERSV